MKDLQILVAVRHCQSDPTGKTLTLAGTAQAHVLAGVITDILPDSNNTVVLTSPAGRAEATALIINQKLGARMIIVKALQGDEYTDGENMVVAIKEKVQGYKHVIVVTHLDAPSGIMNALSVDRDTNFEHRKTEPGAGFVFRTADGSIDVIRVITNYFSGKD